MKKVQIDNYELYHGDCFNIVPQLNITADNVITDPPYNMTHCEWDTFIPLTHFWSLIAEKSKPAANYVFFASNRFAVDLVNSKYKWYRYDLIWAKNNKVGFLNANHQPMRSHESILVFGQPGMKNQATYNPLKTQGKPYTRQRNIKAGVYSAQNYTTISDGTQYPCSVLCYKSDKDTHNGLHPTLKPLALMEFLIQSYTNSGDLVIDPFMGSGTTGVACAKHGRKFIGIEKEKKYFEIAVNRIRDAHKERTRGNV
ncbi:MAG: site-specific DNA-methyltransferase [Planctomycetaceae bacterium]|jgi:site-specific DNA-methyltransferase (adenine-specific)|nr:site-specific DNA-methyltransferase [Planctomycetaceae bacterium]